MLQPTNLPTICAALLEGKAAKGKLISMKRTKCVLVRLSFAGLTFDAIAKALNRDEVWVAAVLYGQVRVQLLIGATAC